MTDSETTTAASAPPARALSGLEGLAELLVHPREFFERVRPTDSWAAALRFAGLMGFIQAAAILLSAPLVFFLARRGYAHPLVLGAGLLGAAALEAIVGPLVAIALGAFGGGLLVHAIGRLSGGSGRFDRSVIIAAYALAPVALERVLARLLIVVPPVVGVLRYTPLLACACWSFIAASGTVALHRGRRSVAQVAALVVAPLLLLVRALS